MALALWKRCVSVFEPSHLGPHQRSAPMSLEILGYAQQEIRGYVRLGGKVDQQEIRALRIIHRKRGAACCGQ